MHFPTVLIKVKDKFHLIQGRCQKLGENNAQIEAIVAGLKKFHELV